MKGGTKIQLENIVGVCKTGKRMTISLTDVYSLSLPSDFQNLQLLCRHPFFP